MNEIWHVWKEQDDNDRELLATVATEAEAKDFVELWNIVCREGGTSSDWLTITQDAVLTSQQVDDLFNLKLEEATRIRVLRQSLQNARYGEQSSIGPEFSWGPRFPGILADNPGWDKIDDISGLMEVRKLDKEQP